MTKPRTRNAAPPKPETPQAKRKAAQKPRPKTVPKTPRKSTRMPRALSRRSASPEAVARAFLAHQQPPSRAADGGGLRGLPRFDGGIDDFEADDTPLPPVPLPVNRALAAVRLAYTLAGVPGLWRSLRRGDPVVVVIETGEPGEDEDFGKAITSCLAGEGLQVVGSDHRPRAEARQPILVLIKPQDRVSHRDRREGNGEVARALQIGGPVIGYAGDPARELPPDLLRAADHRLTLAPLCAAALSLLIEAITGTPPQSLPDEDLAGAVTASDLRVALRPHRNPDAVIAHLERFVAERQRRAEPPLRLEALAGYGEAKTIGLGIAADLKAYRAGRIPWSAVERGLVLTGPPGTGKTIFARALAASAGASFVAGSLAQWQGHKDGHLGHCLGAMRATFAEAKRKAPCVLLIDEIDAVGDRAAFTRHHRDYSVQVVNGLLECLDGAVDREGVVVIGATNLAHRLDPALTRPGRLERVIAIPRPDEAALQAILRHHLGGRLKGEDLAPAARLARGGTGADCAGFVRRAEAAARRAERVMTLADLMAAIGEERPALPESLRRRVAYHEAGHALVAVALGLGEPLFLSLHGEGGTTELEMTARAQTREAILMTITQLLAGREAERLVLGSYSAGAGGPATSDLARATAMAAALEGSWGLGALGPVWLGPPDEMTGRPLAQALGAEVRGTLERAGQEAVRILTRHRPSLDRLAEALIAAGSLDGEEIAGLLREVRPAERREGDGADSADALTPAAA